VAYANETPAGFVVGTRDATAFWRGALLRRPGVLLRVLATRLRARRARRAAPAGGGPPDALPSAPDGALEPGTFPDSSLAGHRWEDPDGDHGARIVFVGVRPAFRGGGIGEALYRAFFDAAAARGATLVLARIARDNHASIRLHRAAGWSLYRDADGVLAVRALDDA
jgi:ribosomal protein S18 acetylase RimI-like enzyme